MYYDVIVLSGGFDPMHVGHLRMIQESAKMEVTSLCPTKSG
jgi:nicotinic acid mononucleotide adenylyltransferase